MAPSIVLGAVIGVLATFPLAALCAWLFRFPVPFAGYLSGRDAVLPALQAVVFYGGPFGGFVVQALLGALGGLAAGHWGGTNRVRVAQLCGLLATIGSAVGVLVMSILDKLIGPW